MNAQQYQQASERFLVQAKQEFADGDLPQASEKGWGATAQILKAIAERGAGSTTATGTTTGSSAGSGPKPATATSAACSTQRVPCTRTSTKTR